MYKYTTNILKTCLTSTTLYSRHTEQRYIKRWVSPTLHELKKRRQKAGPEKPTPRFEYLEWNYDAEVYSFGVRLSEKFKDDILRTALTHKAYANIHNEQRGDAEPSISDNSEFIASGRNIISSVLKEQFDKKYPEMVVRILHDYLTTDKMLSEVASQIGLKDITLCNEFPVEEKTLADTFCAVVSALEKSTDTENTAKFLNDFLVTQLTGKELFDIWQPAQPFEYLKSLVGSNNIEPRICNSSGTNTILANYQVGLYVEKKMLGLGFGETVQIAVDSAALDAFQRVYLNKSPLK